MPMHVPEGAKVVQDSRLTLARVIATLNDRTLDGPAGLKERIKSTMAEKGATYATSDYVVGRLAPGKASAKIDAARTFKLTQGKRPTLTLEQFLDCVTVSKEKLSKHLGADAIATLTVTGAPGAPALFTEFREGVELDLDKLAEQLTANVATFAKVVPIKAA